VRKEEKKFGEGGEKAKCQGKNSCSKKKNRQKNNNGGGEGGENRGDCTWAVAKGRRINKLRAGRPGTNIKTGTTILEQRKNRATCKNVRDGSEARKPKSS